MKIIGSVLALGAMLCFGAQGAFAQTTSGSGMGGSQGKTCKTFDNVHCASNQKDASLTRICATNDFQICNAGETLIGDDAAGGGAGGGLGGAGGGLGGGLGGTGLGAGLVGLAGIAGVGAALVNSNKSASP